MWEGEQTRQERGRLYIFVSGVSARRLSLARLGRRSADDVLASSACANGLSLPASCTEWDEWLLAMRVHSFIVWPFSFPPSALLLACPSCSCVGIQIALDNAEHGDGPRCTVAGEDECGHWASVRERNGNGE